MINRQRLVTCLLAISFLSCTAGPAEAQSDLTDKKATTETLALFTNLKALSGKGILFGHQDATAYGMTWDAEEFRSDVKDAVGKYPGMFGWEIGKLEHGNWYNIDTVSFKLMKKWIIEAYKRGGVNTVSWHPDHPVTRKTAWDVTPALYAILPGGEKHDLLKLWLDRVASFFLSLKTEDGTLVPVIFRPWHENEGNWFWWGVNVCTPEEYIALWKFTVTYLRDVKGVHNLLYAYNWGKIPDEATWLSRYPGDDYVDIISVDYYNEMTPDRIKQLSLMVRIAEKRGKIPALAEGGSNMIKDPVFWTEKWLNPILADPYARRITYMLVWRNADYGHHFGPYPGHPSVPDFKKFEADPMTLFLEDLPAMYQ